MYIGLFVVGFFVSSFPEFHETVRSSFVCIEQTLTIIITTNMFTTTKYVVYNKYYITCIYLTTPKFIRKKFTPYSLHGKWYRTSNLFVLFCRLVV